MTPKRILITNDDGIEAPGLKALERALAPLGETVVVAPEREMSGASQSISLHLPVRVRKVDDNHFAVSGTPTDAVLLALHYLLPEKPHLVVSGINPGANLGENLLYSGTVAAANEATLHGVPAMAVSLASRKELNFDSTAAFAAKLAAKVLDEGLPTGVLLNLNVPRGEVRGVRVTRQSRKITQNVILKNEDPRGQPYYWHDETLDANLVELDSDYAAILAHEISITPLQADRTDYPSLNHLSAWLNGLSPKDFLRSE